MVNALENQTVIILGGTSGIGYGVAKNIIESTKAKIVIASSNEKKVKQAVISLSQLDGGKGRVTGHAVNLDTSVSDDSIEQFLNSVGNFNHLIYTAADPLYHDSNYRNLQIEGGQSIRNSLLVPSSDNSTSITAHAKVT